MGAPCLLADREHDADRDRRGEQAAGQAPAAVAQRKIEGHEREAG
jgi:hypothetical protein